MASSMEQLLSCGKIKLGLEGDLSAYMEDGTEIDDDDILSALPAGTLIYLLIENDPKPCQQTYVIAEYATDTQAVPDEIQEVPEDIESSPLTTSLEVIQRQLLLPWPTSFHIPTNLFSIELTVALSCGILCWRAKSELLGHLYREISKYSYKPSVAQRNSVAMELVRMFPNLKSSIGDGFHAWSQKIYDNMCEENKKRSSGGGKRPAAEKGSVKTVKLPRRGEINFTPQFTIDEEQSSACKELLKEESLKPIDERNSQVIEEHMLITFSQRRRLVSSNILVTALKREYPILFSEVGIKADFKLINGFELEPRFLQQLQKCCEKIKEEDILMTASKTTVTKAAAKKSSKSLEIILKDNLPSDITALKLLPISLADKDKAFLYKIYPVETDKGLIKTSGPETPHVAGHISEDCLCFILIEKDIDFYVHGFVKALMLMFGTYYCCNMKNASQVCRTFEFFQLYLLQMKECSKPPSKLLTFCKNLP